MPASGIQLGVDFGTSNTVAVVRLPDGRSRTLLFDGSPLLPSAVYAEPNGTTVVGRDAIHSARLEPARFEPNPKRRIDDHSVLLGDREIPIVQLVGSVLTRVADEFRRTVGGETPRVTITCPAAWGATRRLVLTDAATTAGLTQARLVPEPVAAATYFTQVLGRQVPVGSVVVVHDFGAGTFDASVVARTSSGFEVLAVDGRDDIGGLDVDEAIIRHIQAICEAADPAGWRRLQQPSTVDERRARRLLWDDVRIAKERLSRQPAADLTVPLLGTDIHLTREELEDLARPIVEQTVRVTQGVIRWANLPQGQVAGVFLVGGSSRMPLVGTLLHRALGEPPVVIDSPELVVAEGSLLAGSAALPQTAGPAPGPQSGVAPVGLAWPSSGGPAVGSPAPGGSPLPVSGAPFQQVSGVPYQQGPATSGQVYPPTSGGPQYQPQYQPYPQQVSGGPQYQAPPPQQVSGGPQYQVPPPNYQAQPTSGAPQYQPVPTAGPLPPLPPPGPPVSAPPVAHNPPVSAPPVSAPPNPGPVYMSGRASTQPPPPPVGQTRPMPRADEPTGYRQASPVYPPDRGYRPEPPPPPYREPEYRDREPDYRDRDRRGGGQGGGGGSGSGGVLKTIVVTFLLVAIPVIAAYVAYKITLSEPLWPITLFD